MSKALHVFVMSSFYSLMKLKLGSDDEKEKGAKRLNLTSWKDASILGVCFDI